MRKGRAVDLAPLNERPKVFTANADTPHFAAFCMYFLLGGGFILFSMFIPTWGNDPICLVFFNWVETTNWSGFAMVVKGYCFFSFEACLW